MYGHLNIELKCLISSLFVYAWALYTVDCTCFMTPHWSHVLIIFCFPGCKAQGSRCPACTPFHLTLTVAVGGSQTHCQCHWNGRLLRARCTHLSRDNHTYPPLRCTNMKFSYLAAYSPYEWALYTACACYATLHWSHMLIIFCFPRVCEAERSIILEFWSQKPLILYKMEPLQTPGSL